MAREAMAEKKEDRSEDIFVVQTVPPPDGGNDIYSAPTRMAVMSTALIDELHLPNPAQEPLRTRSGTRPVVRPDAPAEVAPVVLMPPPAEPVTEPVAEAAPVVVPVVTAAPAPAPEPAPVVKAAAPETSTPVVAVSPWRMRVVYVLVAAIAVLAASIAVRFLVAR